MHQKKIYLDHAATTYLDPRVLEAMLPYFSENFGNPSSRHYYGYQAKKALDQARNTVAEILNCKPREIIFTAGGTEANNLAIFGIARTNKASNNQFITSSIEHSSVMQCFNKLEKENNQITYLKVNHEGFINLQDLEEKITPQTILVSIIYANNEIGTVQNIPKISEICNKNTILFHTDACQAPGSLEIDTKKLGINLMTLNGSKIYGPKGIGLLYAKEGTKIEPLIYGGSQENNLRSGTENVPYIVGFAKALEIAQSEKVSENARLSYLQSKLLHGLMKIPGIRLNGPTPFESSEKEKTETHNYKNPELNRLPNNINVTFANIDGDQLLLNLDEAGICCSTGSACDATTNTPSHVLIVIGRTPKEAKSSIRFTLGKTITEADIDYTLSTVPNLTKKLQK